MRVPLEQMQCANNGKQYLLEHSRDRNLNVEACLYAYSRAFLNEHDLRFREGILHEDVEFTPRIMMQCGKVVELPDRLYHYLVRENSISTQKNKEKNIRDLFQTLREQDQMAEQQEPELKKWMKNAILDSYLNMVQTADVSEAVPEAVGQAFPDWKSGDQLESLPGTGVSHQCATILFYE